MEIGILSLHRLRKDFLRSAQAPREFLFHTKVLYLGKTQCYHQTPFEKTVSGGGFHPESEVAENPGNFHAPAFFLKRCSFSLCQ